MQEIAFVYSLIIIAQRRQKVMFQRGTFIQSTQKKHGQRRTDRADGQYDLSYLS